MSVHVSTKNKNKNTNKNNIDYRVDVGEMLRPLVSVLEHNLCVDEGRGGFACLPGQARDLYCTAACTAINIVVVVVMGIRAQNTRTMLSMSANQLSHCTAMTPKMKSREMRVVGPAANSAAPSLDAVEHNPTTHHYHAHATMTHHYQTHATHHYHARHYDSSLAEQSSIPF